MRSMTELARAQQFEQLTDDQLCCVIGNGLTLLDTMSKCYGNKKEVSRTGTWRFAMEEVMIARHVLDSRPL